MVVYKSVLVCCIWFGCKCANKSTKDFSKMFAAKFSQWEKNPFRLQLTLSHSENSWAHLTRHRRKVISACFKIKHTLKITIWNEPFRIILSVYYMFTYVCARVCMWECANVCLRWVESNSIFTKINLLSVKVKMRFPKPLNRLSSSRSFFTPLSQFYLFFKFIGGVCAHRTNKVFDGIAFPANYFQFVKISMFQ